MTSLIIVLPTPYGTLNEYLFPRGALESTHPSKMLFVLLSFSKWCLMVQVKINYQLLHTDKCIPNCDRFLTIQGYIRHAQTF